jgi:hypothetical protein
MWELENCSGKFPIRRIVMVFLRVRKIIMAWIQKTLPFFIIFSPFYQQATTVTVKLSTASSNTEGAGRLNLDMLKRIRWILSRRSDRSRALLLVEIEDDG